MQPFWQLQIAEKSLPRHVNSFIRLGSFSKKHTFESAVSLNGSVRSSWSHNVRSSVRPVLQGDSFDSSSGNRLLRAYFETSEGLKGIYVTLRLGANYFLVRYTLKWDLE